MRNDTTFPGQKLDETRDNNTTFIPNEQKPVLDLEFSSRRKNSNNK